MTGLIVASLLPKMGLSQWTSNFVAWVTDHFSGFFNVVQNVVSWLINVVENVLTGPPEIVIIVALTAIAFWVAGWRIALFTVVGLLLIDSLQLWQAAMQTLSLVIAAAIVALLIGIPIGVAAAQSPRVEAVVSPALDVMQTMPSFVYLIPMVVLLGLGSVPALIATVIFAMPPAIRLTMLGIQQVPKETVEASVAFGSTTGQTLVKVQLPQAMPAIMAGVNQVIMLALSMVVIAALVGAEGLGTEVVTGLSQLDVGRGFVGGVGIVILAMILDRVTRNIGTRDLYGRRKRAQA